MNLHFILDATMAVLLVLIFAQLLGKAMKWIGQPQVLGEMIAGIVLGPSLFGLMLPELHKSIFTQDVIVTLSFLSNIGLSLYMFIVGMDLDYDIFKKKNLKKAGLLAGSGSIVPVLMGAGAAYSLYSVLSLPTVSPFTFSIFLGGAVSLTAFPMLARILEEKKLTKSRLGSLVLMAASLDDAFAWALLAVIVALAQAQGLVAGLMTTILAIAFVMVAMFVIKPLMQKYSRYVEKVGSLTQSGFAMIMILILASVWFTDYIGIYSVFGGFILGLAMPRDELFQKELLGSLKNVTVVFLLPMFFTNSGLKTDFSGLTDVKLIVPCMIILAIGFISKYGAATLATRALGFSWREASAIGGLFNARGLMLLIYINVGISYNLITKDLFAILVVMAVITTAGALPIYNLSFYRSNKTKAVLAMNQSK